MRRALAFTRTVRGRVGLVMLALVLGLAMLGPLFAPYDPADIVAPPGQLPGEGLLLGTDFLGHDVFSRVLHGGWRIILLAVAATSLAFIVGVPVGLIAGYARNFLDPILMRSVDVVLVFPPMLFFLLLLTSFGTSTPVLLFGVVVVSMPSVARIMYTATRQTSMRAYVEAAVARGERTSAVLLREVLPNVSSVIITNLGLSLTFSILIITSVNFLGLGLQPPATDWALMISENRPVLALNVWAVVAPAGLIALLTIAVNLIGDVISEALGHSVEESEVALATEIGIR